MKKNDNRGGSGKGQGRKLKFNEETVTIAARCPISKKNELKSLIAEKLSEWT
jgi:hypothetical protein